jgi:hypothetical protein
MADIYKVDSAKIVGGPGRLVFKSFDGVYPDSIEEVMSLTEPFSLLGGWKDLGATSEGISTNRSFETEDFSVDQLTGPVDTDITEWTHTLETQLAENSVENRQLALIGGEIIETPAALGTSTTTTSDMAAGATIVNVTASTGFVDGGYLELAGKTYQIKNIQGTAITISPGVSEPVTTGANISPIDTLGTRRIGYGTRTDTPFFTFALISKKKDGSLYMAVYRKCKVSGEDKEQVYGKEKRLLPLGLNAYADGNVSEEENVYYEIEQVL